MRLVSLHIDTVRSLERLRIPFDDLTPDGLWGSPYHLVGLTPEQRAVLDSWNLDVNDVTPDMMTGAADVVPQIRESWPAKRLQPGRDALADALVEAPAERARDAEVAVPMVAETKAQGDPLGQAAAERELVGRAAAAAEASATEAPKPADANGSHTASFAPPAAPAAKRDPTKLRVSVGGKYREAAVKKGKIVLDGQSFDSPAQAIKSVSAAKGDWVFWEYFDSDAGKWRMLDRDWQPGAAS
jgi:hypothetical protein